MTARAVHALAVGLLLIAAPAAAAVIPATPEDVATPSTPEPAIADRQDAGADARIAGRIRAIFGEIEALSGVEVAVRQGVVTLAGTVPAADDIERAERIASRVAGVATVENRIARDVSVDRNLTALGSVSERFQAFLAMLPLIGVAFALALAFAFAGYFIAGLGGLWRRLLPNVFLADLVASAIRFGFVLIGVVVALDLLGAGALMGAVLGGAGVIGIALGFAMRETIENYVASLMLSLRQPFRANDHVLIDQMEGRVVRLTSRATVLMTLDGNHLRIPNSTVFKAVIVNYTRNPQRRFDFDLGIDAGDDPDAGRRVGRDALAALPFVLADPAPDAGVVEVGDSNIVLRFFGWVDQRETDWYKARSRAIAAVKATLEAGGFALPEPIYRLRFDPRSAPLPFGNTAETQDGEAAAPPAPRAREEEPPDVAPHEEVARMVEAERAQDGGQDLLDPKRPVE
ncbi:mechanosensitive ion channel family protein [Pelagerythrobacter rhizovicinus]|uniref:Small-conductance mechanosensitive channel n=1 Tax=Pelagerythrobacter rhizovicinus TaxID=2268576 RepID=A0A4Q2KIC5_9SPHN|nr:mechanosensitive ion channel family protein [Pelagerythrobacter rhizovicinus]RXZ64924.1 mechanosensitive ion channel [Pelagerythrobacter rhizovicinus]